MSNKECIICGNTEKDIKKNGYIMCWHWGKTMNHQFHTKEEIESFKNMKLDIIDLTK